MVKREYCFGIYMFTDKKTGNIVYIGMDSHIDIKELTPIIDYQHMILNKLIELFKTTLRDMNPKFTVMQIPMKICEN